MGNNMFMNLVVGALLLGLVAVFTVSVVYEMGTNYGVSDARMEATTQGALTTDNVESNLTLSQSDTENLRTRFEGGEVDDVDDASGVFSVLTDTVSLIVTPFTVIASIGENIFGFPAILTYIIFAIVNLALILGIWRVLRVGD